MVKGPQLKVCECRIARSSPSAAVAAIFQAKKRTGTGLIPQIFASMKPSQCQKQSLRRDDLSPTPRRSVGLPERGDRVLTPSCGGCQARSSLAGRLVRRAPRALAILLPLRLLMADLIPISR